MKNQNFSKYFVVAFSIFLTVVAAIFWTVIFKVGGLQRFREVDASVSLTGGNPETGYDLILKTGCGSCHQIPGVPAASGQVGPSLVGFRERTLIAGVLSNTPGNLTRWIQNPRIVDSQTAMPDLGLTAQQAADVAAYLYAPTRLHLKMSKDSPVHE